MGNIEIILNMAKEAAATGNLQPLEEYLKMHPGAINEFKPKGNIKFTAAAQLAYEGAFEAAKILLTLGAERPPYVYGLALAAGNEHIQILRLKPLINKPEIDLALMGAYQSGNQNLISDLLKHPEADIFAVLELAAKVGEEALVMDLLKNKVGLAHINIALECAAQGGERSLIKTLSAMPGADRLSILQGAAKGGCEELVRESLDELGWGHIDKAIEAAIEAKREALAIKLIQVIWEKKERGDPTKNPFYDNRMKKFLKMAIDHGQASLTIELFDKLTEEGYFKKQEHLIAKVEIITKVEKFFKQAIQQKQKTIIDELLKRNHIINAPISLPIKAAFDAKDWEWVMNLLNLIKRDTCFDYDLYGYLNLAVEYRQRDIFIKLLEFPNNRLRLADLMELMNKLDGEMPDLRSVLLQKVKVEISANCYYHILFCAVNEKLSRLTQEFPQESVDLYLAITHKEESKAIELADQWISRMNVADIQRYGKAMEFSSVARHHKLIHLYGKLRDEQERLPFGPAASKVNPGNIFITLSELSQIFEVAHQYFRQGDKESIEYLLNVNAYLTSAATASPSLALTMGAGVNNVKRESENPKVTAKKRARTTNPNPPGP